MALISMHAKFPQLGRNAALLALFSALLLASRLLWIHADCSGPYFNSDEGHQNSDARSLVLYGTPFRDSYNPSVLMPLFTAVKAGPFWLFGVNLFALRIPSVLACCLGLALVVWLLWKRGETAAALLLVFCTLFSFFEFSHARMGNHEPILVFCCALAATALLLALENGSTPALCVAVVAAVAAPLIKTSGLFMPLAVALALLLTWRRRALKPGSKAMLAAGAAGLLLLLLVTVFWILPHGVEFSELYGREVAGKRTPSIFWSSWGLAVMLVKILPLAAVLGGLGCLRLGWRMLRRPETVSHLDTVLFAWIIAGTLPLLYSGYQPARFLMWFSLPLAATACRELRFWAECLAGIGRPRAGAWLTAMFVLLAVSFDLRLFKEYYRTLDFWLWNASREVEAMVGDRQVSGMTFDDFAINSERLNLRSICGVHSLRTAEQIKWAFPKPEWEPDVLSLYLGSEPRHFDELVALFMNECPEWKAQYRPWLRMARPHPPGSMNQWFIRVAPRP